MIDGFERPKRYVVPGTNLQLKINKEKSEIELYDTKNPGRFGAGPMGLKALKVEQSELEQVEAELKAGKIPEGLAQRIERAGYSDTVDMGGA